MERPMQVYNTEPTGACVRTSDRAAWRQRDATCLQAFERLEFPYIVLHRQFRLLLSVAGLPLSERGSGPFADPLRMSSASPRPPANSGGVGRNAAGVCLLVLPAAAYSSSR